MRIFKELCRQPAGLFGIIIVVTVVTMAIEAESRAGAEARMREMCDKLLANPVIEDYRFEIQE